MAHLWTLDVTEPLIITSWAVSLTVADLVLWDTDFAVLTVHHPWALKRRCLRNKKFLYFYIFIFTDYSPMFQLKEK